MCVCCMNIQHSPSYYIAVRFRRGTVPKISSAHLIPSARVFGFRYERERLFEPEPPTRNGLPNKNKALMGFISDLCWLQ